MTTESPNADVKNDNTTPDTHPDDANYGITSGALGQVDGSRVSGGASGTFSDVLDVVDTEPHVPEDVDHVARERTRIAPSRTDVTSAGFPDPLVECGCGECPARVDPLADEVSGAFSDVLGRETNAVDVCDAPQPMTVQRAGMAYYVYQTASMRRDDWSSRLRDTRDTHGRYLDAERELLDAWNGDVSTALLSLRVSPVEDVDAEYAGDSAGDDYYGITHGELSEECRRWVPPLVLDDRLSDSWGNVRGALRRHPGGFEDWEYVWVVSGTESAATPHLHVYVWVRDSGDNLSVGDVRPAVESFVRNTKGADLGMHSVEEGESDAAVVETSPPKASISDEQALHVFHERGDEGFPLNTAGFAYVLNQRPDWVLKRLHEDGGKQVDERAALQEGAVAWASSNHWIGSSVGFAPM